MSYGEELVRITIGGFDYVVFEPSKQDSKRYDVYKTANGTSWTFFGWFTDPAYLERKIFERLIRATISARTGL